MGQCVINFQEKYKLLVHELNMNNSIKDKLRIYFFPLVFVKRKLHHYWIKFLGIYFPKKLASMLHYSYCNREIDWDNPKDLNEKINWLKFNSDTKSWSELSDKYAVRKFIEDSGYADILVKLYGVWSDVNEINFDELPDSFVFKSNNGSGTVLIVNDKNSIDKKEVKKLLKKWLTLKFGAMTAEPHYFPIKPLIIAEELLINDKTEVSSSLIDYKFWCFEGEPHYVWTCSNRSEEGTSLAYFDMNWQRHSEYMVAVTGYNASENDMPKPKSFDKMVEICRVFSKGFPQVRIDFYEVNDTPYFGEFTFTSEAGYMDVCTHEYLLEMGSKFHVK